jgi:phosphoglycerate dehydrogenase-like enzyme
MSSRPKIVVEDDPFTRLIGVVLDPNTTEERHNAFADFFAHDEPDFRGWCEMVRREARAITPADVRFVSTAAEMRANLPDADAIVVESARLTQTDLDAAPRLKVVQRYGVNLRNIDVLACAARGIAVRPFRRRANISCAEHAFLLMLMLARRVKEIDGVISIEQAAAAGYDYRPFNRKHTANANWARIPSLLPLNESTVGIIGLGEIGRELAIRAKVFGMTVLYHQRNPLPDTIEQELGVRYAPLDHLLETSDFVIPLLPPGPATHDYLDRARIAMMKHGAFLINVSRAQVINRTALIDALKSGAIGGFGLDPQYEEPGRSGDELLSFPNVILTPHTAAQPRFNALRDLRELIAGLSQTLAAA